MGIVDTRQSPKGMAGALDLEPLYHQDLAGAWRSKDGRVKQGCFSLRRVGVWNSCVPHGAGDTAGNAFLSGQDEPCLRSPSIPRNGQCHPNATRDVVPSPSSKFPSTIRRKFNTGGGNRTHTGVPGQRILSPLENRVLAEIDLSWYDQRYPWRYVRWPRFLQSFRCRT